MVAVVQESRDLSVRYGSGQDKQRLRGATDGALVYLARVLEGVSDRRP